MDAKRILRTPLLWILVLISALVFGMMFSESGPPRIDTSAAMTQITDGNVESAKLLNNERMELTLKKPYTSPDGTVKDAKTVYAFYVDARGGQVVAALNAKPPAQGVDDQIDQPSWFGSLLFSVLPILVILGLFWFLMGQMQGGGNRVMQFGKSRAKLATKDTPKVTFADVAGCDEAIEELQEIKEFLQEPAKFLAVGAKIPKGVLLYGQPGTGKTLLARAVAGEAGVPFYSISGSDFVEMFVGVGASRVRDLFEQAKANAPAIVFVDEIDAVGRHRGAGMGGGHDEREQTLNQLLVEMDGFDVKTNVILIAATNRPDILDPALLRPGRFDRQIAVDAPDMIGRHRILEVHAQGKPVTADVDLLAVARRTPGFTGADLANVLNEAALLTARGDRKVIDNRRPRRGHRPRHRRSRRSAPASCRPRSARSRPTTRVATPSSPRRSTTPTRSRRSRSSRAAAPSATRWSCRSTTSTRRPATRSSTSSPTPSVAASPRRSSSTSRRPVRATTSRRPPGWPARWSPSSACPRASVPIKLGQSTGEVFLGRDMGHQRDYSEEIAAHRRRGGPCPHRRGPRRGVRRAQRQP